MMGDHILPKRVYYIIFGILMACTYLTVQIAFLDLGRLNTVAALVIAVFKDARGAVLHAREIQHAADVGRRPWQRLLARDHVRADAGGLSDSRLAHVRMTAAGVV